MSTIYFCMALTNHYKKKLHSHAFYNSPTTNNATNHSTKEPKPFYLEPDLKSYVYPNFYKLNMIEVTSIQKL